MPMFRHNYLEIDEECSDRESTNWKASAKEFLYSHVGLGLLVILYCAGGMFLFLHIEQRNQDTFDYAGSNHTADLQRFEEELPNKLWKYKQSKDYNTAVTTWLSEWHLNLTNAIKTYGYEGRMLRPTAINTGKWTIPTAFLFTITVVTTIGYGNIAPVTPIGRVVCILFALIGIPLMLMYLANVGSVMADGVRALYSRGLCCCCSFQRRGTYKKRQKNEIRGDESREPNKSWDNEDEEVARYTKESDLEKNSDEIVEESIPDDDEFEEFDSFRETKDVDVPMFFSICLILGYILIGAVMFSSWNDWGLVVGLYFSFVTLSTIGYGDYQPGWEEMGTTMGNVKLIVSATYIIIGLAVLSMAFNLMMEELKNTFTYFGKKMGLSNNEEEVDGGIENPNNQGIERFKGKPEYVPPSDDKISSINPQPLNASDLDANVAGY